MAKFKLIGLRISEIFWNLIKSIVWHSLLQFHISKYSQNPYQQKNSKFLNTPQYSQNPLNFFNFIKIFFYLSTIYNKLIWSIIIREAMAASGESMGKRWQETIHFQDPITNVPGHPLAQWKNRYNLLLFSQINRLLLSWTLKYIELAFLFPKLKILSRFRDVHKIRPL